ncbi:MAG: penicillin-binding protein [Clostridioides sp.]|jgi:penicillin-binding protein 2|nr:penicillin-binding protein [Clostridioides sp.]
MEDNKQTDRLVTIRKVMIIAFIVIFAKILYMTTVKHAHYAELAENKTYKKLSIEAPRGEIKDRYGRLIAGNKNLFTVQISSDDINKSTAEEANKTSLKLMNLLIKNKEKYVDDFPIYIENGKYYYTFDRNIRDYKKENKIPLKLNAKDSFYYLVNRLVDDGTLTRAEAKMEPAKLQKKLNESGYYPPILVSKWMFADQRDKEDWLLRYKIKDEIPTAKEAFREIRNNENIAIGKDVSDEDARKILLVRDLVKSQGYSQYNPVTIAKDIKEKTIAQIEESKVDLVGVSVANEPVRYYPDANLASHILGYVGKIPSTKMDEYVADGYSTSDMIGISGVEKSYEKELKGKDGYKMVQVDTMGRISQELESKEPESGDTVYLTIDKKLQKVAEDSLKQVIKVSSKGGTFPSKLGNVSVGTYAGNAKSGALIAVDVKTGEVLASASYPDYDPNKFSTGITLEDYKALQPENQNDLLAASPLLNLVSQGAFQPGSTFKLITAMSGLENGLNPNYTIQDPGVIRAAGGQTFGDYSWNHGGGNHGATNLYKAIQESCNIYFATIATGKNWVGGADPGIKMGAEKLLATAKLFGLDKPTGLGRQIEERIGRVPNTEDKLKATQSLLKDDLMKKMANDFTDVTKKGNPEEFEKKIDEIVGWTAEEKTPGRVEAMKRLKKLKVKDDRIEPDSDLIVYSYLNFAKWGPFDVFNLAIGQGENAYTPAQMARAVAAIANGGKLLDLTVVEKSVSSDYSKSSEVDLQSSTIPFKYPENLKEIIKGMKRVSTDGSAKRVYSKFPVPVASKTGTAEKSGKIPTDDEYGYLIKHIGSYGVKLADAKKLSAKMMKDREKELSEARKAEIKKKLKEKDLDEKEKVQLEEELKDGVKVKLENTDKINAAYLRRAMKELNPNLTDEQIDRYKSEYASFAWSVSFAPADKPEILVVCVIPQGDSSAYSLLAPREIIGSYLGFINDDSKQDDTKKTSAAKKAQEAKENKAEQTSNTMKFSSQINR